MVATPADILSVVDARAQLRVDTDGPDSLIETAVRAAVAYVSKRTGLPIIDRMQTFSVMPARGPLASILLPTKFVLPDRAADATTNPATVARTGIVNVKYWEISQELREAPGGNVIVADLGRREVAGDMTYLYPPSEGWPEVLSLSLVHVTAWLGIELDGPGIDHVRTAVTAWAHIFYEAPETIRGALTAEALINALIDYPV